MNQPSDLHFSDNSVERKLKVLNVQAKELNERLPLLYQCVILPKVGWIVFFTAKIEHELNCTDAVSLYKT